MDAEGGSRSALWILRTAGTGMLLVSVVMLAVLPVAPVERNVPGFVTPVAGFELARRPADVFGILGHPGAPGRAEAVRRMDLGNRIDFLFLLAYSAFYAGIALWLRARAAVPRGVTGALLGLAFVMAVGDALENRELLALSQLTDSTAMAEPLARLRACTLVKWYAIYAASGIVAPLVWRERGWWRWSAVGFGGGALVGFASLVHLPAIEYGSALLVVAWIMTYVRSWRPVQASAKAP